MRDQVHVDRTDAIRRTRQAEERRAAEIADVEEPELAELQQESRRARVLGRFLGRETRRRAAAFGPGVAPASGAASVAPPELTIVASTPVSGNRSPGFGSRCCPLARTAAYA